MKILYFYILSNKFGSGHFKRAQIYEKFFQKKKTFFKKVLLTNKFIPNAVRLNFLKKRIDKKHFNNFDYIFFDITHPDFYLNKYINNELIKFSKIYKDKIIIIDGLGKFQLNGLDEFLFKSAIYPYFLNYKDIKKRKNSKYFIGNEFILKDPSVKFKNKKLKQKIDSLVFTSGGSDLDNSSYKFLELFNKINLKDIKVFIIKAKFFKNSYTKKLLNFAKNKNINLKILTFKKNIFANLYKKDLVITSSGLTKYELLDTNIPMVVYAANKLQKKLNNSFASKSICPNLNNLNVNKNNVYKIKRYILNFNLRAQLMLKNKRFKTNKFITIYNYLKNELQ